jgi:cellulose synthase/poly-beta-1,6-N-acetylglucosamine synthase-like glycosyltransferase
MTLLTSLMLVFSGIYCFIILRFAICWRLQKPVSSDQPLAPLPFISVIIAIRNEEQNLPSLIKSLLAQESAGFEYEIIFINDHSTDKSIELLDMAASQHEEIMLVHLDAMQKGKKAALQVGIDKARGELLAFTDGDCSPGIKWLSTLALFYAGKNKPDLVIGLVDMKTDSILQKVFRLEFLSLILSSSGAALSGHPMFCNGANLAVNASIFKKYSQNKQIASGDDVFLLHWIKKQKGKIAILKSTDHIVYTVAPKTPGSFLEQRNRWASKSFHYTDMDTVLLALLIAILNLLLVAGLIHALINTYFIPIILGFSLKLMADAILFFSGKDLFDFHGFLKWLPVISLFYPFYIFITVIVAIKKPFTWKGRKYIS